MRLRIARLRSVVTRLYRDERKLAQSFLLRVASAVLLLAVSIILARALGVKAFGEYAFALSIVSLMQIPAAAGLPTLVLRESVTALADQDFRTLRELWAWSARLVMKLSAGASLSIALAVLVMGNRNLSYVDLVLLTAVLAAPITAFAQVISARLRALNLVIFSQVPLQILQPALLLIMVGGLFHFLGPVSSLFAVGLYLASISGALIALIIAFRWVSPVTLGSQLPPRASKLREWRHSLFYLTLLSGLQVLNANLGLFVIGLVGTTEAVAEFKLAYSLAVLGAFGGQVAIAVLGPEFARAYSSGNQNSVASIAKRLVSFSMITSLPILVPLALFSGLIVSQLFGTEFKGASLSITILAACYAIVSTLGYCSMLLIMSGNERWSIAGQLVSLVLSLILLFLLVPSYGSAGGAMAVAAGVLISQGFLLLQVLRKVGVDPTAMSLIRLP